MGISRAAIPEIHLKALVHNERMKDALRQHAAGGNPLLAELRIAICGFAASGQPPIQAIGSQACTQIS